MGKRLEVCVSVKAITHTSHNPHPITQTLFIYELLYQMHQNLLQSIFRKQLDARE